MSEAPKHTPGPLAVFPVGRKNQFNITYPEGSRRPPGMEWPDYYVEFSGYFGAGGPHLFAAAPKMLKALKKHEHRLSVRATDGPRAKPTVAELNEMLHDFRAAIAEAEGRS